MCLCILAKLQKNARIVFKPDEYINFVHIFGKSQQNLMARTNIMGQKVSFWPFWGNF